MAILLRWAALLWTCCSIFYIAFFNTTSIQLLKAFLPPLTLGILSIAFLWSSWYDDSPDDDGGGIRWRELFEYLRLTKPVDRSKERKVVNIDEKKRA